MWEGSLLQAGGDASRGIVLLLGPLDLRQATAVSATTQAPAAGPGPSTTSAQGCAGRWIRVHGHCGPCIPLSLVRVAHAIIMHHRPVVLEQANAVAATTQAPAAGPGPSTTSAQGCAGRWTRVHALCDPYPLLARPAHAGPLHHGPRPHERQVRRRMRSRLRL
jgi:hypothetical protein